MSSILVAYDADGNIVGTLSWLARRDGQGNAVGILDFEAHELAGGSLTDIWRQGNAVGSGTWPEFLGSAAQDFKVELRPGPKGGTPAIRALVHRESGFRRDRASIEAAIAERVAARVAERDTRHAERMAERIAERAGILVELRRQQREVIETEVRAYLELPEDVELPAVLVAEIDRAAIAAEPEAEGDPPDDEAEAELIVDVTDIVGGPGANLIVDDQGRTVEPEPVTVPDLPFVPVADLRAGVLVPPVNEQDRVPTGRAARR